MADVLKERQFVEGELLEAGTDVGAASEYELRVLKAHGKIAAEEVVEEVVPEEIIGVPDDIAEEDV